MTVLAHRLQPLGVGDVLDEAIRLWRRHFFLLTTIVAVVEVPLAVARFVVRLAVSLEEDPIWLFAANMFVTYPLVSAVLLFAVAELQLGHQVTVKSLYQRALGRLWPIVGLALVYHLSVLALFGTVVGSPLALYFAVAWAVSLQVLLFHETGVRQALRRSRDLVRGHWWRTFGNGMLLWVPVLAMTLIFSSLYYVFWGISWPESPVVSLGIVGLVFTVLEMMLTAVLSTPISTCGFLLMYHDLRIRKEGFDIELLVREVELHSDHGVAVREDVR